MSTRAGIERAINKDVHYSAFLGPLRVIVPIAGYAVLYPLILKRFGAEVLGIWALMSALPLALSILEVGLGQFLLREMAVVADDAIGAVKTKYTIARLFYLGTGAALALLLLPVFFLYFRSSNAPYDHLILSVSVSVMIIAIFMQFVAKLDAAILSGKNQNYFTQLALGLTPIVFFAIAILGAMFNRPIEGLVAGNLLSQIALILVLKRRLTVNVPGWDAEKKRVDAQQSLAILKDLIRDGWHLYSMSIGLMLREPLLRFSLAAMFGLKVAAIYEIAMRVARAPRDLFAAGFGSLFASFTFLLREGKQREVIILSRRTLLLLLVGAGVTLTLVAATLPMIFTYWLGELDPELVSATRLLIIWCLITLLNVPFWYILLAAHNEAAASRSVWVHLGLVALLYPLSHVMQISLDGALAYWVGTSLFTQGMIYYSVHRDSGLFVPVLSSAPLLTALAVALTMAWVQFSWSQDFTGVPFTAFAVAAVSGFVLVSCLYWESKRSWRA